MRLLTQAALLVLVVAVCGYSAPLLAQPESLIGSKAVTTVTYDEVEKALAKAGVSDLRDGTADPNFPSFGGQHSEGASLQATLYACDTDRRRCSGVELHSLIPATSLRNAQIIVGSVERSAFGIDAQVFDLSSGPDSFAVQISTYLIYDHGVSDQLLTIALDQFFTVIGQTKGFMLKDDPAHAELWARQD